jgi:hypothetical protein
VSEVVTDSLFSWVDEGGSTNTLDVDVVMSSDDVREAKLTDHVVEDGAVITDHVVIQPESVSFELVVTQTPTVAGGGFSPAAVTVSASVQSRAVANVPIKVQASAFRPGGFLLLSSGLRSIVSDLFSGEGNGLPSSMQGSAFTQRATSVQASVLQATTPVDRVNDVHDALTEILTKALLVTLSFKGRLYVDYLLERVELNETAGMFGAARFKVRARAFRTVTGTQVNLPDPEDFRALPKVSKGNKNAATPDPDPTKAADQAESIISRNGESVTGVFNRLLGKK